MSEVEITVTKLNEILGTNFSLVAFDELRGRELSKIVNDLFTKLSPEMKMNIVNDDPAVVGQKHYDFLTFTLSYKPPPQQAENLLPGLTQGDPKVVYPVLFWTVSRMPENAKRVYLAKYLLPVDVPDDVRAMNESVQEVYDLCKTLQREFIEVHKQVERHKKAVGDPVELQRKIKEAEADREQLGARLSQLKQRYEESAPPQKEKYYDACATVKGLQENGARSTQRMGEQKESLRIVEKQLAVASHRLQGAEKEKELPVAKLLQKMKDEATSSRLLLSERLPADIEAKEKQVAALDAVLGSRLDLEAEKKAVIGLADDIKGLEAKHRPKLSEKEEQALAVYRQQAALVAKRRTAAQEELDRLEEEMLGEDGKRQEREKELEGFRGSRVLVGEDFKRYAGSLRGKKEKYNAMKAELQELRGEYGVLLKTIELLKLRDEKLEEILSSIEEKQGVSGARQVKREQEDVAARQMEVNDLKGKTLDELTKIVEQFVVAIKDKRTRLTPQIFELRVTRTKSQQIEQDHQTRKEAYESAKAVHSAELAKTVGELTEFAEQADEAETQYHQLMSQIAMSELTLKRADADAEFERATAGGAASDMYDENHRTFAELLTKTIQQLEMHTKTMRERKKDLDDHHLVHAKQVIWFRNLKKLLDVKLMLRTREVQRESADASAANYLKIDHDDEEEQAAE